MHLLIGFLGGGVLHPLHGNGYQLWSGIASDIGEVSIFAALLTIGWHAWRHVNCAAPKCPRVGKHVTADGHHRLCRLHFPDVPDRKLSLAEIHERHHAAKQQEE